MGEVVFEGEFEVDPHGGLTYAGEGDFGRGRIAGDDGREGGLVETEVWFGGCERVGVHEKKSGGATKELPLDMQ